MGIYYFDSLKNFEIDRKQTAANIRKFRIEKGLTQSDIEKIFDISHTTANKWENVSSPKTPSLEHLVVLSKLFSVNLEQIICVNSICDNSFVSEKEPGSYKIEKSDDNLKSKSENKTTPEVPTPLYNLVPGISKMFVTHDLLKNIA